MIHQLRNPLLGEAHEDHGAVGMQVVAEADLIAAVHLDRADVNPRVAGKAGKGKPWQPWIGD